MPLCAYVPGYIGEFGIFFVNLEGEIQCDILCSLKRHR